MKKIWSLLCALGLCLMTGQPAASVYNGAPRLQGALYETIENVPVYGNLIRGRISFGKRIDYR